MATLTGGLRINPLKRWMNNSVQDVLPRKYKRTAFITSLIYLLDDTQEISTTTFNKIIKLFEIGLVNETSLKFSYHARKYIWGDLKKTSAVTLDDRTMSLVEAIDYYKSVDVSKDNAVMDKIVDVIFSKVPDFIKYGSEKLTRHDIFYVLFFLKHKNAVEV